MILVLPGLVHVRRLWGVPLAVISVCAFVWHFYDFGFEVSTIPSEPPRGLGSVEMGAMLLSACLPAMTQPGWGGREHLAPLLPRMVHTGITAGIMVAPFPVYLVWSVSVTTHVPVPGLPHAALFLGNVIVFSSLGVICTTLAGPLAGPTATIAAFGVLVTTQQIWPQGWSARHFSSGDHWTIDPFITAIVAVVALAVFHASSGVPRYRAKFL